MEEAEREHLKGKALLLIKRERELYTLRMKHEQLAVWLNLARSLPELFATPQGSFVDSFDRLRKALITGLRLQRVTFWELDADTFRPLTPLGPPRPFSPDAASLLREQASGFCNDPIEPGFAPLADAVGLHKFIWSRIELSNALPVLMVAGFDRTKSPFQRPFEAGDVAHFGNTAQHVQALLGNSKLLMDLERSNELLERRVLERTSQLEDRNRSMRLVLDNVDEALLTIDAGGCLAEERSATVDRWFGSYAAGTLCVDYFAKIDGSFAEMFSLGFDALKEGVLPTEVCLEQLPMRFRKGERQFRCSYSPLLDRESLSGLLIVVNEVTEQIRQAQEEAEQSEMLALFQSVMNDRAGYVGFAKETDAILTTLGSESVDESASLLLLHTLKGNAACVGAAWLAELCHQAETVLIESGMLSARPSVARVRERWATLTQNLSAVLGDRRQTIDIAAEDLQAICDEIRRGTRGQETIERLMDLAREPLELPLRRLADSARSLARRLGRGDLDVDIEAPGLRIDRGHFDGLWSVLVHVVRNAIDHGIERGPEREEKGKPLAGKVRIRALRELSCLVLEIGDDGRGIDWERVRALARERGMPHESHDDLMQALIAPRFSTRDEVTSTSGRGVGMSAVSDVVRTLGGTLSVNSVLGVGTCWRLSVPWHMPLETRPRADLRLM